MDSIIYLSNNKGLKGETTCKCTHDGKPVEWLPLITTCFTVQFCNCQAQVLYILFCAVLFVHFFFAQIRLQWLYNNFSSAIWIAPFSVEGLTLAVWLMSSQTPKHLLTVLLVPIKYHGAKKKKTQQQHLYLSVWGVYLALLLLNNTT